MAYIPLFICFKLQTMLFKTLFSNLENSKREDVLMVLRDTFSLLGSVRLLLVLCPAAAEHILHSKAQTPSTLLLLLILSGKRLCSRSCQNDAGDTRRWVFKHRYVSPKIIWSKEKSKFQNSCTDHGLYITLSRQGFCFTGIMRNTVWLIFH